MDTMNEGRERLSPSEVLIGLCLLALVISVAVHYLRQTPIDPAAVRAERPKPPPGQWTTNTMKGTP